MQRKQTSLHGWAYQSANCHIHSKNFAALQADEQDIATPQARLQALKPGPFVLGEILCK